MMVVYLSEVRPYIIPWFWEDNQVFPQFLLLRLDYLEQHWHIFPNHKLQ